MLHGDGARLIATHLDTLDEIVVTGLLHDLITRAPGALATLKSLGEFDPLATELHDAVLSRPFQELDLGSVVRGSSWDMLFLELTGQCNEACSHCYAESSPLRQEKLSLDEVLRVVREAHVLGFQTLQLTGGDPLVSNTFLAAARLAHELKFDRLEIYTNGLALTDRVADDLAECGADFAFSFYSHQPEIHDKITGTPGSHPRTLAAISRALTRNLNVRVGVISMESNRADIEQTVALLKSVGVRPERIGLEQERGVGRGAFADAGHLVPYGTLEATPEDLQQLQQGAMEPIPSLHGGLGRGGKLCVSYTADVYPCIFARHRPLGNIRESSLTEILARKLMLKKSASRSLPTVSATHEKLACSDCQGRDRLLARLVPV